MMRVVENLGEGDNMRGVEADHANAQIFFSEERRDA
jgi:hypothetical protein